MIQLLLLLTALAAGPKYPAAKDDFVNDFAEVLAVKDMERMRSVAKTTLNERGVPIVVATISSLKDYDAGDWTIERYATNLYNEWGIGDKTANKGVLLLVSVKDRKLRIATGTGLGNFDDRARQVIDGVIVPRFKSGDMPGGIAAGVEAIAKWFGPAPSAAPSAAQPPVSLPPERIPGGEGANWTPRGTRMVPNSGGGGFSCIFMIIALVVVMAIVRAIFGGGRGYGGYGGSYYGGGGGGWGRFLLGGLAGFVGSQLLQGGRHREWGGGGSILGGGSGFGGGGSSGGGSSFGGGFSSGGGASGSW